MAELWKYHRPTRLERMHPVYFSDWISVAQRLRTESIKKGQQPTVSDDADGRDTDSEAFDQWYDFVYMLINEDTTPESDYIKPEDRRKRPVRRRPEDEDLEA